MTNAAAIAKRKLEQKPKSDWKDKKTENFRKLGTAQKSTEEPQIKVCKRTFQEIPLSFFFVVLKKIYFSSSFP